MTNKRSFHIGDVLSVTTGRILSPRGLAGMQDILAFMVDAPIAHTQMSHALEICRPILCREHPQLSMVDLTGTTYENKDRWLADQVNAYGEHLSVSQLTEEERSALKGPIEATKDLIGHDRLIVAISPEA